MEFGSEVKFTLKVTFDPKRTLPQGQRHVVILTRLTYYDQYQEDQSGNVISKGTLFSEKLVPTNFSVKIPGIAFYSMLCYAMLCYAMLSYPILFYSILSCPVLSYPILSYPILFCSVLFYSILL